GAAPYASDDTSNVCFESLWISGVKDTRCAARWRIGAEGERTHGTVHWLGAVLNGLPRTCVGQVLQMLQADVTHPNRERTDPLCVGSLCGGDGLILAALWVRLSAGVGLSVSDEQDELRPELRERSELGCGSLNRCSSRGFTLSWVDAADKRC